MDWSRASVLAVASVLLLVGGVRVIQAGADGQVFITAGLIVLGVWVAVELHSKWHG